MINIIVVDDERLILQGFMHSINWESHGYHVIGAVESARRAMELCEETTPDLAILDINMAGMNGLELGSLLKERFPDVIIIVLTAHSEFQFARESVRRQFDEYLLKPEISYEEILAVLNRFRQEAAARRQKRVLRQSDRLLSLLEQDRQAGEPLLLDRLSRLGVHGVPAPGVCLCIQGDFSPGTGRHMAFTQQEAVDLLVEFVGESGLLLRLPQGWALFMPWEGEAAAAALGERIVALLEQMGITANVGVSKGCQWAGEALGQALQALRLKYYVEEQVIVYSPQTGSACDARLHIQQYLLDAERYLSCGNYRELYTLTSIFVESLSVIQAEASLVADTFIRILLMVTRRLESTGKKAEEILGDGHNLFAQATDLTSYTEMESWFSDCFIRLVEPLIQTEPRPRSETVNKVLAYLAEHYTEPDFSLGRTARHFYISYAYLSQLFSREMGESFNHYLTGKRLDKAKQLLADGVKLEDAALQSGYNDASYFNKVFKKETGRTPGEYRKERVKK